MEYKEYEEKQAALKREYEIKKIELNKEYALSNRKYNMGDKILCFGESILVDKIEVVSHFGIPDCLYSGIKLRKDGTPFKSGERDSFYGANIERFFNEKNKL